MHSWKTVIGNRFNKWLEREPLRYKIWGFFRRSLIISKVIPLAGVTFAGVYFFLKADNTDNIFPYINPNDKMLKAFEDGRGWESVNDDDNDDKGNVNVNRLKLENDLLGILRPTISKQYFIIVGENGTGKSTAVKKALSTVQYPFLIALQMRIRFILLYRWLLGINLL